jgi:pilus assembly protein CpaF
VSAPIIAVVNAKGGSGATTVSSEIAKTIRRSGNVAIVDGDLAGRRALAVVLDCVRQFDEARVPGRPATVNVNGITAVEIVETLDSSFAMRPEAVESELAAIDNSLAIIADVPQPFAALVRPLVARASAFYIVLEPNLLGTSAARATVSDLCRFGVPLGRISIVTNVRNGRSEISTGELQKVLGCAVVGEIPTRADRNYSRAIDALSKRVLSIVPEAAIDLRRASAVAPLGDARSGRSGTDGVALSGPGSGLSYTGNGHATMSPADALAVDIERQNRDKIKSEVHEQLAKRIDLVVTSRAHSDGQKLAELRQQVAQITDSILAERLDVASAEQLGSLRQEIIDETLGLGPLEDLMRDEAVTEIMVNGHNKVYVERQGKIELSNKRFVDERQLKMVIERIIAPIGRRIDESQPMVDARLPDGSRVNAIIDPLSLDGATLTIRRFGTKRLTMDDLVAKGALPRQFVNLLRALVEGRLNILVSGGTGSGKTTFLNILSTFLPFDERIVTIEDAAELLLKQEHVVRLESRPPNIEERGEIRIRDLVRNALRMRPDRIIVGECRGGEALDMLQAMNTGHDGSLTTIHANSPRDALSRLETLVLMAGFDLPVRAIREQIASAVNIIIQTERLRDGSRKIVSISEVIGMEGDVVTMQELVKYKQLGVDKQNRVVGEFQYTGVQPHALARFEEMGIAYDVRELAKLPSVGALW